MEHPVLSFDLMPAGLKRVADTLFCADVQALQRLDLRCPNLDRAASRIPVVRQPTKAPEEHIPIAVLLKVLPLLAVDKTFAESLPHIPVVCMSLTKHLRLTRLSQSDDCLLEAA
jgi:hypothetical protein